MNLIDLYREGSNIKLLWWGSLIFPTKGKIDFKSTRRSNQLGLTIYISLFCIFYYYRVRICVIKCIHTSEYDHFHNQLQLCNFFILLENQMYTDLLLAYCLVDEHAVVYLLYKDSYNNKNNFLPHTHYFN